MRLNTWIWFEERIILWVTCGKDVKISSTTVKRYVGNHPFGNFTEVEDVMVENNEVLEESQVVENDNFDEDFGLHHILD